MKITREVITDLWPLYLSGEASADSRALVEEYLSQDAEFAQMLKDSGGENVLKPIPVTLPPDHEAKSLQKTKKELIGDRILRVLALGFTALAFGRIISDTSWDVSPRLFIIHVVIAAVLWIAYVVKTRRARARAGF